MQILSNSPRPLNENFYSLQLHRPTLNFSFGAHALFIATGRLGQDVLQIEMCECKLCTNLQVIQKAAIGNRRKKKLFLIITLKLNFKIKLILFCIVIIVYACEF